MTLLSNIKHAGPRTLWILDLLQPKHESRHVKIENIVKIALVPSPSKQIAKCYKWKW